MIYWIFEAFFRKRHALRVSTYKTGQMLKNINVYEKGVVERHCSSLSTMYISITQYLLNFQKVYLNNVETSTNT
jgi:hypothetical protein